MPVAELVPPSVPERPKNWLGMFEGRGKTMGDIISPAVDPEDWEVLRS